MIRCNRAFTLLELLMAIAIFGMVIGLAYSSFNATFHIITNAESQTETYAKARMAMERIMGDLESYYPGKEMIFQGTTDTIGGKRADTLQFSSTAHIQLHPDTPHLSQVLIHYQVEEDPDSDSLLLYRKEESIQSEDELKNTTKDSPGLLLCDNLEEVAFDYRNKDGEDLDSWGNDEGKVKDIQSLPYLITITLRFNDGEDNEAGTLFKTSLTLPVAKK
ncbi:MAG TPA: type II secretion system protein [Desulfobacterales bacterium]|nr:type II secretion system protein [Desulfobacterales bacterium]HIP39369.1 type II secretion system protein [Desulfocapsa sulfexigens]